MPSAVRDAKRSVAQRAHARTCVNGHCDTWHSRHHSQHALHGMHQSWQLSSPLPSTDHLPFSGGLRTESLLVQLMYNAAGVRQFAGLCQGTQTRTNPTREKKDHIHHSTHTERVQRHCTNTRVARTHGTRLPPQEHGWEKIVG